MDEGKLIRIYSGSEITALLLKDELEQAGVMSMIKNDFQSGVIAGFSGGVPSDVDLLIEESYLAKAEPVVSQFLKVNPQ
ncbi:MAG: putative signal transducing protein [Candidatus Saccharibacteria bacterium]